MLVVTSFLRLCCLHVLICSFARLLVYLFVSLSPGTDVVEDARSGGKSQGLRMQSHNLSSSSSSNKLNKLGGSVSNGSVGSKLNNLGSNSSGSGGSGSSGSSSRNLPPNPSLLLTPPIQVPVLLLLQLLLLPTLQQIPKTIHWNHPLKPLPPSPKLPQTPPYQGRKCLC